ncbi:Uncharacterized protein HZ326_25294 [Fusarium oxysporum f. sp. albedinis]|nr:Uncharacterized protein HZ326_25294 [Fusarium oxysporum f. sp. albedinis]
MCVVAGKTTSRSTTVKSYTYPICSLPSQHELTIRVRVEILEMQTTRVQDFTAIFAVQDTTTENNEQDKQWVDYMKRESNIAFSYSNLMIDQYSQKNARICKRKVI